MDPEIERIARIIVGDALSEEQLIAMGCRPKTLRGWVFWLRYWSPLASWLRRWAVKECP